MKLNRMAKELLMIEEDIGFRMTYPSNFENCDIEIFKQTWGNTSGGFEGIGGCAITTQTTYVIFDALNIDFHIYFSGRFAYSLKFGKYNKDIFIEDLKNRNIKGLSNNDKYYLQ